MNTKTKNIIDLICNIIMFVTIAYAVLFYFKGSPDVFGYMGSDCFHFFTNDSNIMMAIAAAIMAVFNIKRIKKPDTQIPRWLLIFKYMATVSVALTFFTVVLFLGPMIAIPYGFRFYFMHFKGNVFWLHAFDPLLAMLAISAFEDDYGLKKKDALWGIVPMLLYGGVYFYNVLITKSWTDFYFFTFGGNMKMVPISVIGMIAATYLISLLIRKLNMKRKPKNEDSSIE